MKLDEITVTRHPMHVHRDNLQKFIKDLLKETHEKFDLPEFIGYLMISESIPNNMVMMEIDEPKMISTMLPSGEDEDDSEEITALRAKLEKRGVKDNIKKRKMAIRHFMYEARTRPVEGSKFVKLKIEDNHNRKKEYRGHDIDDIDLPDDGFALVLYYYDTRFDALK